jgi:hypothetical protein
MSNILLTKSFRATAAAITGFLIVKASAANGTVEIAGANTDLLVGVVDAMGVAASGMADIGLVGQGEVRLGGTVAFGDQLTSDAAGKAIKALPSNSTQVRTIGFAHAPGVADDIIPYHIAPGTLSKASA